MDANSKKPGESRLVWRISDENPMGELLELVPKDAPAPRGRKSSRKVVWTRVSPAPAEGAPGLRRAEEPAPEPPLKTPVERGAPSADHEIGWRASSWDLLNGLIVRDVSDTIPQRTFDALFSANEPAARPPSRKRR